MKTKLKKGDLVRIISGKQRGKQGLVTRLDRQHGRVFVEGITAVKHVKATQNAQGSIQTIDVSVNWSNVMVMDPKKKKEVTRVRYEVKDHKKQRIAVKSNARLK